MMARRLALLRWWGGVPVRRPMHYASDEKKRLSVQLVKVSFCGWTAKLCSSHVQATQMMFTDVFCTFFLLLFKTWKSLEDAKVGALFLIEQTDSKFNQAVARADAEKARANAEKDRADAEKTRLSDVSLRALILAQK